MSAFNEPMIEHNNIALLLGLCVLIHNTGKANAFFDMPSHVQKVGVRVYIPHWTIDAKPQVEHHCYLTKGKDGLTDLECAVKSLESVLKFLNELDKA